MKPAVIYAAKSTLDPKGSIQTQIADCRALAERDGLTVVAESQDENASAYSGSRGPGLASAFAECERLVAEHGSCALLVQHSDRLARGDAVKAAHLIEYALWAAKAGVQIFSVQDPEAFTAGDFGMVMTAIAGTRANIDSKRKSDAVKSGKRREAERGRWSGGPVPDGLAPVLIGKTVERLVEDPERAPLVRRIFEEFDAGHSTNVIARRLNREGLRTQRETEWQQRRIRSTIQNPLYVGRIAFRRHDGGDESFLATNVEPIIDGDLFDRVQVRLAGEARDRGGRRPSQEYGTLALHRLAVCNRCGKPMQAVTSAWLRKDGTQKRNYRCKSKRYDACDAPQVDAARVDAAVVAHLEHLFIDVEAWRSELAQGASQVRGGLESALSDARSALVKAEREVTRLGERYKALEGAKADAVLDLLVAARQQRETCENDVQAAEGALVRVPDQAPDDEILDLHAALADIVRGGDAADLNDRLRQVFDRFEVDTMPDGTVVALPVLREDVVERYAPASSTLRYLTSDGVEYTNRPSPVPSAGLLVVGEQLHTTRLNPCAYSAISSWSRGWPSTSATVAVSSERSCAAVHGPSARARCASAAAIVP
jgi:DNA invertase Pin-like site-specific DNA recombinase